MKVLKTKNYNRFHLLPMNREIMARHAEKMAESIQTMGIIRPVVCCQTKTIDGTDKLYVLDGQHLLTGLQRLDMEVPYIKIKVGNELDVVKKMGMLNSSSKSWTLMDYVNAYRMYLPDYMQLFKLRNLYNIELSMLAAICNRDASYDSGQGTHPIKIGVFKVTNSTADLMCKQLTELFMIIPNMEHSLKRKFLRAFLKVDGYDHPKAIVNTKKHKKILKLMGTEDSAIEFIQENVFGVKVKKSK